MQPDSPGPFSRMLKSAARIEPNELSAVLLSFLFVFVLMTAYSIMKPVRDALAADWGDVGLAVTWSVNFVLSLTAVSVYGAALSYIRFRAVVPGVYAFFALTFLSLYVVTASAGDPTLFNKIFYIWVSVFSLFQLSVFWSFMADLFSRAQATRLFGFITAGTSAGAIVGPTLAIVLVDVIGTTSLILVAAGLLLLPIPIILMLERLRATRLHTEDLHADLSKQIAIGRNPFAGFSILFSSRFMTMIGVFILLYVTINTFVYFELQNLTGEYGLDTRTKIWSWIEVGTQALSFLIAIFVTSRIVDRLGMRTALALMPAVVAVGVLLLIASPTLVALAVFQVLRRVGNYAVTRPSREMLFTIVGREARFKAKPVIDIVLYRGGDMLTAWLFTLLATGLGLGLAGIALVISGIAAAWTAVALYLGRNFENSAGPDAAERGVAGG